MKSYDAYTLRILDDIRSLHNQNVRRREKGTVRAHMMHPNNRFGFSQCVLESPVVQKTGEHITTTILTKKARFDSAHVIITVTLSGMHRRHDYKQNRSSIPFDVSQCEPRDIHNTCTKSLAVISSVTRKMGKEHTRGGLVHPFPWCFMIFIKNNVKPARFSKSSSVLKSAKSQVQLAIDLVEACAHFHAFSLVRAKKLALPAQRQLPKDLALNRGTAVTSVTSPGVINSNQKTKIELL